ncbi:hypothetical protein K7432_003935, partial [Basidiobolus ranarum]
ADTLQLTLVEENNKIMSYALTQVSEAVWVKHDNNQKIEDRLGIAAHTCLDYDNWKLDHGTNTEISHLKHPCNKNESGMCVSVTNENNIAAVASDLAIEPG